MTPTRTSVVTPTPTAGRELVIIETDDKPITAYPNPYTKTDGTLSVAFTITREADSVNIKIYTVSGRLVRSIDTGPVGRGDVEAFIPKSQIDGLARGVYFYRIWARSGAEKAVSSPQKIVILK